MKKILVLTIALFCFTSKAKLIEIKVKLLPPDTFIYSELNITKLLTDVGFAKSYDWLINAGFYDNVTHTIVPVTTVKYGTSSFAPNQHFNGIYTDTTGNNYPDSTRQWQVLGQGAIPNFTFMPTNPMPNFTDYSLVTGTVTISSGVTIPFSGISNATNVTIIISDGVNQVIEAFPVNNLSSSSRLSSGATLYPTSVTIPSSDLNVLSPTNNAFINILVSNVDYQVFSGKRMAFIKTFMYKRDRVVIQ